MQIESNQIINIFNMIKEYDDVTAKHCIRVSMIAGKMFDYVDADATKIRIAGLIHDIGKVKIPYELITKPGKLTPAEKIIVDQHSILGYQMLKQAGIDPEICAFELLHHNLDNISVINDVKINDMFINQVNVLRAADIMEAVTAKRPYHEPVSFERVIEILQENYIPEWIVNAFEREPQMAMCHMVNNSQNQFTRDANGMLSYGPNPGSSNNQPDRRVYIPVNNILKENRQMDLV